MLLSLDECFQTLSNESAFMTYPAAQNTPAPGLKSRARFHENNGDEKENDGEF
jgi:hypothetical protein